MKITYFVLVLILASVLIFTACSPSPAISSTSAPAQITNSSQPTAAVTTAATPKYGGVLKIVVTNQSNYFGYSGDMYSPGAKEISMPCLENLLLMDPKGQFDPSGLVTAYQVSQDLTSVTFALRKDVKFHDGTDFNAQAVKWALDVSKKVRVAGTELFTSVEVIDDYNIKVNVKHFDNRFLQAMGDSKVSSPAAFEKYGEAQIHTHPVGTGPFKFVSFTPDVGATWERFDGYWGGKPYLDGIKTFIIPDDMAKAAALQSGDVDILFNVSTETAVNFRSKGYIVAPGNMPALLNLWPDSANASSPLSNLLVRQAIEYAMDKEALAKLGNGFWQAPYQPCEPSTPGYIPNFEGRRYNVSKAKELLAQAGYPNGFEITIIWPNTQPLQDLLVSIQQMLSKVDIKVNLEGVTNNVRTNYQKSGWQNGYIVQQLFCGPSQYLSALNYCLGGDLFVNTTRPDGFKEALNEAFYVGPDTVDAASRKLNTMLYENATALPMYLSPIVIYAMSNNVHDPHIYERANVWHWSPEKAWLSK